MQCGGRYRALHMASMQRAGSVVGAGDAYAIFGSFVREVRAASKMLTNS
jgi:hypothetical protein